MTEISELFKSENLTHITNYSGEYIPGNDYQQFDFIYYTGDGRFYYAKQDVIDGAGVFIQDNNRLSLIPNGPATSEGGSYYILDTFSATDQVESELKIGHVLNIQGSTGENDGLYKIIDIQKDIQSLDGDTSINGDLINVISAGGEMNNPEPAGPNVLTISAVNAVPSENSSFWTSDDFFFDADYGSSVNFRANNYRYEYGNGYYILQPKNINNLVFEADLQFKNRTNREANAIVHFLENHQGQHEQDKPSPNLKYSQGISGFRWDGNATFHPYDNTEVQGKKFYCSEWNHSLNFENSNDIKVKLRNLDASILNKSVGLFVADIPNYSETEYYEKNDIVLNTANQKYYYCKSDQTLAGQTITLEQENWSREFGYHKDVNTDFWSRDFFWKPSISLSVAQKPKMNEIGLGAGYTQIYRDGINNNLLSLDLQFNNRTDSEARAILHFLEQHYGAIPFQFNPPAPYESTKTFVCQEWNHVYNYKNNHSIRAKFEQYAINMSAQEVDALVTPVMPTVGELICKSPVVFSTKNIAEKITLNDKIKKRLYIENIGGSDVEVSEMKFSNNYVIFKILSQLDENDCPLIIEESLTGEDYIFQLPNDASLPFDLSNKYVKMGKSYSDGVLGGDFFTVLNKTLNGSFANLYNGYVDSYFQDNKGVITSIARTQSGESNTSINSDIYLIENFIQNKKTNIVPAGKKAYVNLVFTGQNPDILTILNFVDDSTGANESIIFVAEDGQQDEASLIDSDQEYSSFLYISNDSAYENLRSLVTIYISS